MAIFSSSYLSIIGTRNGLLFSIAISLAVPIIYCAYNIWWHPLAKFPGPKKAALTPIWTMWHWLSGENLWMIKDLHEQYGAVVRISPNQLSFCSGSSWKDIHGHRTGRKAFLKGSFYEPFPDDPHQIVSVSDPGRHSAMRKSLSHGFSASALAGQEDRVQHFVNILINQIDKHCTHTPGDMVKWYNFVTFDAIGELALGDPFGCLESGNPHYWIDILFASIKNMNFMRSFEYFPFLRSLVRMLLKSKLLPRKVTAPRMKQMQYAREKLEKRLVNPPQRTDFLEKVITEREKNGTSFEDLQSQAILLIVAGSETTSTALSGITYYLCRNPQVYERLTEEIRSTFSSFDQITGRSTERLTYLKAVIDEGLRIYPPIAAGLPRISPGETVDGHYVPKGAIVNVNTWVATHIEANFHDPFKFIPERWIDPDCKDDKAASQPFLLGSRVCLGRNLALLELRIILSKILWTFDMKLMDDDLDWVKANKNYVFWEKPELPVQFHRRAGVKKEV